MKLERVIDEIEKTGSYWRDDSCILYKDGVAELFLKLKDFSLIDRLLPNLPSDTREKIKYLDIKKIVDSLNFFVRVEGHKIDVSNSGSSMREAVSPLVDFANSIQYPDVHITRRAGSYILILNGKAVYATESLIEYCPLAEMIFTRQGTIDKSILQQKLLEELNQQAIGEFQMFSEKRALRECEAKVPFGSSEMTMDAMKKGYLECTVQVCDGVGTVITFNPESSQGVGAVMTGTFYTTPIDGLIERCYKEGVFPVFPETANIDQLTGVRAALRLGKKKIAVTTAADYNRDLAEIAELEKDDIEIYKFALCSTGIDKQTAEIMANYSDITWSCASKYAREIIAPKSLVQIGLKIPVYVMTERGWDIAKNRLLAIDPDIKPELDQLPKEERYFIAHSKGKLIARPASEIKKDLVHSPRPLV